MNADTQADNDLLIADDIIGTDEPEITDEIKNDKDSSVDKNTTSDDGAPTDEDSITDESATDEDTVTDESATDEDTVTDESATDEDTVTDESATDEDILTEDGDGLLDEDLLLADDDLLDSDSGPDIDAPLYGTISGGATFEKILDAARIQDQMYMMNNFSSLLQMNIFTGTYGSTSQALPVGPEKVAYATYDSTEEFVTIVQTWMNSSLDPIDPLVEMIFPPEPLAIGQYDMDPTADGSVVLLLKNESGVDHCILACSFSGTTNITAVTNIEAPATDGGNITFNATEVKLYYPTETPVGDYSSQFGEGTICPKE